SLRVLERYRSSAAHRRGDGLRPALRATVPGRRRAGLHGPREEVRRPRAAPPRLPQGPAAASLRRPRAEPHPRLGVQLREPRRRGARPRADHLVARARAAAEAADSLLPRGLHRDLRGVGARIVSRVRLRDLVEWCRIPADALATHPGRRIPLRLVKDSAEMGALMAAELADLVEANDAKGADTRAIVPCGPSSWYAPWTELVNRRGISLRRLTVFHMDECLDWQGRLLPRNHPYNFRTFMERHFYGGIPQERNVPEDRRFWLQPDTI